MDREAQKFANMYYLGIQKASVAITVMQDTAREFRLTDEEMTQTHDRIIYDLARRVGLSFKSVSDDVDSYMASMDHSFTRDPRYKAAKRGMMLANPDRGNKRLNAPRRSR